MQLNPFTSYYFLTSSSALYSTLLKTTTNPCACQHKGGKFAYFIFTYSLITIIFVIQKCCSKWAVMERLSRDGCCLAAYLLAEKWEKYWFNLTLMTVQNIELPTFTCYPGHISVHSSFLYLLAVVWLYSTFPLCIFPVSFHSTGYLSKLLAVIHFPSTG